MTTNLGPSTSRRRKHTRLDRALYACPGAICSVTAATLHRRPVFVEPALARSTVTVLRERAEVTGVPVYAYCVMPDHVPLVLSASFLVSRKGSQCRRQIRKINYLDSVLGC